MKDDFLYKFQKAPRKEFAAALYKRISKPMVSKPTLLPKKLAFAFTILLTVVTVTLTFSPTARVMAADFLHQIGVLFISERRPGDPVLISSPSPEQVTLAQATATPIVPVSETASAMDTAISQAGFLPFLPSTLPKGYSFNDAVAAEYLDDQQVPYGWGIFVTYLNEDGGYLSIHTNRFDGRQQDIPMGGQKITDVRINGNSGIWIEDFLSQTGTSIEMIDILLWEENGYVLAIQSNRLSLEEALQLAQSLKQ
jgi:hypothetical protein